MAEKEDKTHKIQEDKPQTSNKLVDKFDKESTAGKETPDNFSKFSIKSDDDENDAEKLKDKPARREENNS